MKAFGRRPPASTSVFVCGMCVAPFNKPKPAAYVCVCALLQFITDRIMSAQFQTCWPAAGFGYSNRLWFLFSCSEMHVDTCIACILQPSASLFFCPLRYCQFYGQDEFCRYNMFNHHFFEDEVKK